MRIIKKQGRRAIPLTLVAMLVGGIGLLIQAASSQATHCSGITCTEDVFNTKHNLAANTDIQATGTTEVCVFCHTPHGGRTDVAGGGAPLWNRALPPTPGNFQNYNSPNFDNLQSGSLTPGPKGVSLACLSCHDGVIAFDALINAPGSGGFQSANRGTLANDSPGTSLSNISFAGPGVDGTESFKEGNRPDSTTGGGFTGGLTDFVGPTGGAGMEPFPNLGRNLSDDHPISMRMPDTDPQFTDALGNLETPLGASANIRGVKRAGRLMPADKRNWIRLYNSDNTNIDWVECASCHNPHTPRTTFLRLPSITGTSATGTETPVTGAARDLNHEPNQGSLICLTCHQK
jgi:hypothetical protein